MALLQTNASSSAHSFMEGGCGEEEEEEEIEATLWRRRTPGDLIGYWLIVGAHRYTVF